MLSTIIISIVLLAIFFLILKFGGSKIATELKADYDSAYNWIHNALDSIARYWYWLIIGMFAVYFMYDVVADKVASNNLLETKYVQQVTTKDIAGIDKLNTEINVIKSEQGAKKPLEYFLGAIIVFVLSMLSATGTLRALTKYKFLEMSEAISVWSSVIIYGLHFAFWSLLLITYLGN